MEPVTELFRVCIYAFRAGGMLQQRLLLFQRTQMLSACMGLLTTACTAAPRDLMPFSGLQKHSHTWHSLTQKHTLNTHTQKIKFKSISHVAEVRLWGIILLICNFPLYRTRVCAKFSLTLLVSASSHTLTHRRKTLLHLYSGVLCITHLRKLP